MTIHLKLIIAEGVVNNYLQHTYSAQTNLLKSNDQL